MKPSLVRFLSAAVLIGVLSTAADSPAHKPASAETSVPQALSAESLGQWEASRSALRAERLRILGPLPGKSDLRVRIASTVRESDHDRLLVSYETEPGVRTDAYLLLPHGLKSPAPAAVVFHATSANHILQTVGLADKPTRHLALHLVRRGYITLSSRCFIYGEADETATTSPRTFSTGRADYKAAVNKMQRRVPGLTGMGKMLFDGMRAVDFLAARPDVDPQRIACLGHSLGAKEALYLAAFDPRVKASFASEGGAALGLSNWDDIWYLGPKAGSRSSGRDHHELLALTAPRSFLILGGGQSDGERTRPIVDAARGIYALYGRPEALQLQIHVHGHDIPEKVREQAFDWLDEAMKKPAPVP